MYGGYVGCDPGARFTPHPPQEERDGVRCPVQETSRYANVSPPPPRQKERLKIKDFHRPRTLVHAQPNKMPGSLGPS